MNQSNPRPRSMFRSLFHGIDLARRVFVNLLFVFFLLLLWAWLSSGGGPPVPSSTALVLDPRGVIVEQLAGDPFERAIQKLTNREIPESLLKDLVEAVRAGRDDKRVKALYLDLRGFLGASLPILQDLQTAIDDFKTSGKKVVASADFYNDARYYLAAGADEIHLHPMGAVMFEGYGRYRTYYKQGLDRYEIDWNVFRVGKYKSAVEPYLRNAMSNEVKEVNLEWLGDLWNSFLGGVAAARGISEEELSASVQLYNDRLARVGDTGQMALDLDLVDHLSHDDQVRQRMAELVGEDDETGLFHQITYGDYLEAVGRSASGDGEVAVIVAKGAILPGRQAPGLIGGQSTGELIRQARNDEGVKALVLRVDSGGGSAFASEVIRRELELVREAGKPVVVSMGSYAASGGYWISTSSDEVWASPNTVTGSIGIFAYFPTFQKPLAKYLGVRVDGVGTTWLSGVRPERELPEEMKTAFQLMIEQGYDAFLEHVSRAREMSVEEVHELAQGRVWMGMRAKEHGLVDELGGLSDAVASAARRAGLEEGYGVRYLEQELDFEEELMIGLLARADAVLGSVFSSRSSSRRGSLADAVGRFFLDELDTLSQFQDPRGIYAHCLCEIN